jgi:hypothetical protein
VIIVYGKGSAGSHGNTGDKRFPCKEGLLENESENECEKGHKESEEENESVDGQPILTAEFIAETEESTGNT